MQLSEFAKHDLLTIICQRDRMRVKALSDRLINGINSRVEHVIRNGDPSGYPGCVNLSFAYVEGESLLMALKVRYVVDDVRLEGADHPLGCCALLR